MERALGRVGRATWGSCSSWTEKQCAFSPYPRPLLQVLLTYVLSHAFVGRYGYKPSSNIVIILTLALTSAAVRDVDVLVVRPPLASSSR